MTLLHCMNLQEFIDLVSFGWTFSLKAMHHWTFLGWHVCVFHPKELQRIHISVYSMYLCFKYILVKTLEQIRLIWFMGNVYYLTEMENQSLLSKQTVIRLIFCQKYVTLFFSSNKSALYSSPWQPAHFGILFLRQMEREKSR